LKNSLPVFPITSSWCQSSKEEKLSRRTLRILYFYKMANYSFYYIKGLEKCREGNFEEGIAYFDKALALLPSHTESIYNRAKAKFKLKRLEECIIDLELALSISPQNPVFYSERAVVYYHMGHMEKSLQDLDAAAALEPENPYRYSSRAYIKDKAGDLLGAIEDYAKAIALDPEDAISYNNKGLVEEKLGYYNRSKESFRKADALAEGRNPDEEKEASYNKPEEVSPELKRKIRYPIKDYYKWGKRAFSTKEGFKDFISFTIDILKGKS
jgi:tetratricopeptide (TPR) repeat protein